MIEPEPLQQIRRTYVRHRGRELAYFSGCDYFRLASHPAVIQAVNTGLRRFGLNVAASRRTTGNHSLYLKLEKQLAEFFHADAAVLVSNGYLTNLVATQALAGQFSHALIDEKAHASPADATQFLNCPVLKFKHHDAADLARTLARCGGGARVVVLTDGMFAGDGSIAPLRDYLKLLPPDGLLLVDDAHGAGTLGKHGGGAMELEGVSRHRVVQCVTLSKAFGGYGGAVLCSRKLRDQIVTRSSIFIGSTPLPLPLANAACTALAIVKRDPSLRARLNRNSNYVKDSLRRAGLALADAPGPIVPFQLKRSIQIPRLHRELLAAGIFPSFIKYPGGPAKGFFRFVISSEHTKSQLDKLLRVLIPFVPFVLPPDGSG